MSRRPPPPTAGPSGSTPKRPRRSVRIDADPTPAGPSTHNSSPLKPELAKADRDAEAELEAWQEFAADHYEIVEQLPLELHRNFRLLRELDDGALVQMAKLEELMRGYVLARLALVKPDVAEQSPEEGGAEGKAEADDQLEPAGGIAGEATVTYTDEVSRDTSEDAAPPPTVSTPTAEPGTSHPNPDGPQVTPGVPVPDDKSAPVVLPEEGNHVDVKTFPEARADPEVDVVEGAQAQPAVTGKQTPGDEGESAGESGEKDAEQPMDVVDRQPGAMVTAQEDTGDMEVDVPSQDEIENASTDVRTGEEGGEEAAHPDQPEAGQYAVEETYVTEGSATETSAVEGTVTETAATDVEIATALDTPVQAAVVGPVLVDNPHFAPKSASTQPPEEPVSLPRKAPRPPGPNALLPEIARLARELVRTGEEKVAVAVGAYNAIDRHIRALDSALTAQEASILLGLRPSTLPSNAVDEAVDMGSGSGKAASSGGLNASGRGGGAEMGRDRGPGGNTRTRRNAVPEAPGDPKLSNVKNRKGKGKARADDGGEGAGVGGRVQEETEGREETYSIPADPNEPRYCYCNRVSFGEMIGCDNDECPLEWFHLQCAGLDAPPTGKWWCDLCAPKFGPAAGHSAGGGAGGSGGGGGRARSRGGGGGGKARVSGGRKR